MPKPLTPFRKAWLNWKTLRLPWRKRFLVGLDLEGNTYWEFKDLRGDNTPEAAAVTRWRRIVEYPSGTHPGEVKVSPQWHQWLRYVRQHPPSLAEQQQDVVRQQQMRVLAAKADARWAGAKRVDGPIDAAEAAAAGIPDLSVERGGGGGGKRMPLPGMTATTQTSQTAQTETAQTPQGAAPQPAAPQAARTTTQTQTQQARSPPPPPPPQPKIYPDDPWKKAEMTRGAPGQKWQPQAWTPPPKR